MTDPEHLPFTLQQDESVILFCRRHWLYLWPRLALRIAIALIPVALVTWVVAATAGLGGIFGKIVLAIELLWLVYWAIRAYFDWYSYVHDIWVVTNQRIVDAIKPNWFNSHMASADLIDVEDIAVERSGILQTAFNFGEVRCQTAGERPNFLLSGIPDPANVLAVVDAARDAARRQAIRPLT